MPKVVDHEARRQELVDAASRCINRLGIDAVTVREIAKESGYSAGTLAHYFADKDAILRSALERADDNIRVRIEALPDNLAPMQRLTQVLSECLPLDETRRFELTLDVNFWARALNETSLRDLQHEDHDTWRRRVLTEVKLVRSAGIINAALSAEDQADILIAFVDGIGLQALVYPELLPPERVEALLHTQLANLVGETSS